MISNNEAKSCKSTNMAFFADFRILTDYIFLFVAVFFFISSQCGNISHGL